MTNKYLPLAIVAGLLIATANLAQAQSVGISSAANPSGSVGISVAPDTGPGDDGDGGKISRIPGPDTGPNTQKRRVVRKIQDSCAAFSSATFQRMCEANRISSD